MGIETAALIAAGGSQLIGTGMQYFENRSARKRADQLSARATSIADQPLESTDAIKGALNTGQDSFMQYLRANPTSLKPFQFDTSQAFKDLQAKDTQTINDQALQLSAGAGSLGARFGSGFAAKNAMLRGRFASDIATRNAGIAQSSFNTALNAGMQDYQFTGAQNQSRTLSLLQMLQSGQLSQRQQQLAALGFGAGLPQPGFGAQVSQAGGDFGSLLMLMNFLKGPGGGPAPTKSTIPTPTVNYNSAGF